MSMIMNKAAIKDLGFPQACHLAARRCAFFRLGGGVMVLVVLGQAGIIAGAPSFITLIGLASIALILAPSIACSFPAARRPRRLETSASSMRWSCAFAAPAD